MKSSYSILCSTVSAVAITLVMSGLDAREASAQDCSPAAGTDISTIVGGVNAQDYICSTANAPLVNEIADQSTFTNSGTIKNTQFEIMPNAANHKTFSKFIGSR